MPTAQELAVLEYQAAVDAEQQAKDAVLVASAALDDARSSVTVAGDRLKLAEKALLTACAPVRKEA